MDYIMPQELAQEILDYLVEHPYKEVFILGMKLQPMKPKREEAVEDPH